MCNINLVDYKLDKSPSSMSVLVTMLSLSHTLLFSSLILKVMSSDLPPGYGLDLGDGKGIQLLRRLRVGGEDCPFYQSTDDMGSTFLYKTSSRWVIKIMNQRNRVQRMTCQGLNINVDGNDRFKTIYSLSDTDTETLPRREGWLDARNGNVETSLEMYKLEECIGYEKVFMRCNNEDECGSWQNTFSTLDDCTEMSQAETETYVKFTLSFESESDSTVSCQSKRIESLDSLDISFEKVQPPSRKNAYVSILGLNCRGGPSRFVDFDDSWNPPPNPNPSTDPPPNTTPKGDKPEYTL